MIRRIADALFRALLAVVLAALVWVIASQEQDPTITNSLPTPLPIVRLHEPPGAFVYNQSASSVMITARAPQSWWQQLAPDQFKAEIDLAGQPFGQLNLPVQIRTPSRAVEIIRIEPATIDLHIEPSVEQAAPVRITTVGDPALGYAVGTVNITPTVATLRGPESFVGRVANVRGTINLQGTRQSLDQSVRLSALDKDDKPVGFVALTPETVQARVQIDQLGGFRDLAVKVVVRGQVAAGYRISNVTVTPPIVTVFGSTQSIDQSPGFVETVPISVTDAQADMSERVPLNVPGGLSLLGDPSVRVTVQVEAIQGGLTVQQPVTLQGLREGLEAKLGTETIELILTGPLPKLQSLKPDDVRVVIDLGNLGAGTHQIKPQAVVPQGIVAETMLPATIQVTIGPKGTLTLSPIATPTMTPTRTTGTVITPTVMTPTRAAGAVITPTVAAGSRVREITEQDNGKTFRYTLADRFSILLDQNKYPREKLTVEPDGILGQVSNVPTAQAPFYAVAFAGVKTGTCTIKNGDWAVTIVIVLQTP